MFDPQTLTALSLRRALAHLTFARICVYGASAIAGFVLVAFLFDRPVVEAMRNWPEIERDFFHWLTDFGKSDWVLLPTALGLVGAGIVLWLPLRLPYAWRWAVRGTGLVSAYVFLSVAIPGLATVLIKRLAGRARPYVEGSTPLDFSPFDWLDYTVHSFPSGHATTAIAMAIALFTLTNGRFRGLFLAIGLLVGFSRIVVGDHYLTDVLGGLVVGALVGLAVRDLFATRRWGLRVEKGRVVSRLHLMFVPLWRRLFRQARAR